MTTPTPAWRRLDGARALGRLLGTLAYASPTLLTLSSVVTLARVAATCGYVVGVMTLAQQLTDGATVEPVTIALTLGSWAVAQLLENGLGTVIPFLQAAWTTSLTERVLASVSRDGSAAARAEHRAQARQVVSQVTSWMGLDCIRSVWSAIDSRLVGLVGVLFVAQWSWLAAVLVAVAQLVSSAVFTRYLDVVHRDLMAGDTPERRRSQYARDLLLDPASGKEVRLFGLADWLVARHHRDWLASIKAIWGRRAEAARPSLYALAGFAAVALLTLSLLARDIVAGTVDASTAVAVLQGLALSAGLGMLGDTLVQVGRARVIASSVLELEARPAPKTPACEMCSQTSVPSATETVLAPAAAAVDVDAVTFAYAGTPPTLRGLTFSIAAGETIAVVGRNGAGKSTIVRLLAGLEVPGSGSVRVGGHDAGTLCAQHRPAVVFQAFAHLPSTLQDNVDLGHDDAAALTRALAGSGADRLRVAPRTQGDDVPLTPTLRGGTDLSGGEWQRVALARGLAAVERGASVLVLDEPTSALDIRVEQEVFDRIVDESHGVTTVLVTHRLASARRADRVLVVDAGVIVESGTHEELMSAGGLYASMFTTQAAQYRSGATEPPTGPGPEPVAGTVDELVEATS